MKSIVINWGLLFILKFWSLLCYFLGINKKLFTVFYPQIDGKTERPNSTIKAYLRAFINWEQNNWAKLMPIVEFTYNNVKNANIGHTPFRLNCSYHPRVSFQEDVDRRLRSCSTNKLAEKLRELIEICC